MTTYTKLKPIEAIFLIILSCFFACKKDTHSTILSPNELVPNDSIVTNNEDSILNVPFVIGQPSPVAQKVYMHYMVWYGDGISGNHWSDGSVNTPLVGYYNSKSWATHIYHILLSSLIDIDGAVVNIRTSYDAEAFPIFVESVNRISAIYPDFDYDIMVSYDDQDATLSSTINRFNILQNDIIPNTIHYLHKNDAPVIFVWNYDGFLTPEDYRAVADGVFYGTPPILLRNELDLNAQANAYVMNSSYPWVQGWAADGSNWGKDYINWFYNTQVAFEASNQVEFVTGGVWPGFDDRNTSWGQNRWIDRQGGLVYDSLWHFATNTHQSNLDWVIIETWNDFNEGTEIEPINGSDSYQYLLATHDHIHDFKNTTANINVDADFLSATVQIYEAAKLIEDGDRDYELYYPELELAIEYFLKANTEKVLEITDDIISG